MPIHLRAEPGDYAEACLLPGDPLRAKYIAENFLDDVTQVNAERGLLGFTGKWEGKAVSVQGTGMGCPSATIVFEELIQLGVKRLLRVGTCGGLQANHSLGDLIVALSAVPADATATHLVAGEPHCPTASWELIHEAVHVAKSSEETLRVGPIVSSDLFYNPDQGQYERWSKRGILAVEMEAAALFTVTALRGVHGGCLLTVSDIVVEGEFVRISDDELRAAVDRMTRIALEPADVDKLAGEVRSRFAAAIIVGAWCYLRPSELLALERGDVDGNELRIRRTLDGSGGTKASGKTRRSLRPVPLPARAAQALAELPPRLDTRLLFPAPSGGPYDACNWRRREFKWAAEAAGFENVTPYTLRHSGISWALAAGVPTSDVARFAGTSVTMLETTYHHLLETSADAARQRLDAFHAHNTAAAAAAAERTADGPPISE